MQEFIIYRPDNCRYIYVTDNYQGVLLQQAKVPTKIEIYYLNANYHHLGILTKGNRKKEHDVTSIEVEQAASGKVQRYPAEVQVQFTALASFHGNTRAVGCILKELLQFGKEVSGDVAL